MLFNLINTIVTAQKQAKGKLKLETVKKSSHISGNRSRDNARRLSTNTF